MSNVLDTLIERGFVYQTTDDGNEHQNLRKLFDKGPVTIYNGIDPTANSLHVGHLVPVMSLVHLQQAGHRPLIIVGGGTAMIGDPTGKTEMRQLLTREIVDENVKGLKKQLSKLIDFEDDKALIFNNADWIEGLNYLDFVRDVGRHFTVNRMLSHDCFKIRYESDSGLSFLEFNYMLLQAYDFLVLLEKYNCTMQIGGSDQWGNIVAGVELIRRSNGKQAYGITIPLLMTPSGKKMGKTEKGAVWLDPERTSPYDYFQYWVNQDDQQVGQLLRFFTLLDIDKIKELEALEGAEIRKAKEVLAFEATKLIHGEEEASKAQEAAKALFSGGGKDLKSVDMPTYEIAKSELEGEGVPLFVLAADGGLCKSRGEARRLAKQGGLYLNDESQDGERVVSADDLDDEGQLLIRAGKKRYLRVITT